MMNNIDKSLLKYKENHKIDIDHVEGVASGFWKDSWKRLKSKKSSVLAIVGIIIISIFSILVPLLSPYEYDRSVDDNKEIGEIALLPPRVPVLEKVGIFDGTSSERITESEYEAYLEQGADVTVVEEIKSGFTGEKKYDVELNRYHSLGYDDKYFIFGTDQLGRDYFLRVWQGMRLSLYIGVIAAMINLFIGVVYGGVAGFFGGSALDIFMMRIAEIIYSIPTLVWVTLISLMLGTGLTTIIISLLINGWISTAVVVRSQFLKLRDQEFVLASKTLGASNNRLIVKHLFPNVVGQIVILLTVMIPSAIFYEAFLTFIGLGVPIPVPSIGNLINTAKTLIFTNPRYILIPSVVISVFMLMVQILSNGLRDALDPRMR